MNKVKKVCSIRTLLAFLLAMLPFASYANGFSINIQSASGAGTGEAGRASTVIDATIIYGNPAGLVRLQSPQFTAGFGAVRASLDISNTSSRSASGAPVSGTNKGDSVPSYLMERFFIL